MLSRSIQTICSAQEELSIQKAINRRMDGRCGVIERNNSRKTSNRSLLSRVYFYHPLIISTRIESNMMLLLQVIHQFQSYPCSLRRSAKPCSSTLTRFTSGSLHFSEYKGGGKKNGPPTTN